MAKCWNNTTFEYFQTPAVTIQLKFFRQLGYKYKVINNFCYQGNIILYYSIVHKAFELILKTAKRLKHEFLTYSILVREHLLESKNKQEKIYDLYNNEYVQPQGVGFYCSQNDLKNSGILVHTLCTL